MMDVDTQESVQGSYQPRDVVGSLIMTVSDDDDEENDDDIVVLPLAPKSDNDICKYIVSFISNFSYFL